MTSDEKLAAIAQLLESGEVLLGLELETVTNEYSHSLGKAWDLHGFGIRGLRFWSNEEAADRFFSAIARGKELRQILAQPDTRQFSLFDCQEPCCVNRREGQTTSGSDSGSAGDKVGSSS